MLFVKMHITRFVSEDPQPGIVEVQFVDARERTWTILDKTLAVSKTNLSSTSHYPIPCDVACVEVGRESDAMGREIVRVDLDHPWHISSVEGESQFFVFADQLREVPN